MTTDKTTLTPEVLPAARRPVGRPSKIAMLVPNRSTSDRARVANEYHALSRQAAQDAVSYAVMAGLELAAVKELLGHGQFLPWVERNCEFGERTARRYMDLAERMVEFGQLKSVVAELPNGQVQTAGDRKALLAAIRETADGNTLRQLYLDFGIIKESPECNLGGAREGAGRPTREEMQRKIAANATAEWKSISSPLGKFITEQRYLYMDGMDQDQMLAVLRGAVAMVEEVFKRRHK